MTCPPPVLPPCVEQRLWGSTGTCTHPDGRMETCAAPCDPTLQAFVATPCTWRPVHEGGTWRWQQVRHDMLDDTAGRPGSSGLQGQRADQVAGDHEKKNTSVIVCDKTPTHAWEMTRCSVQMAADTCDDQDRMEAMVPTSVPAGQHGTGDVACLAEPAPPAGLRGHVERSRRLRQALADVPMQILARSSLLKMAALQDGSREESQRQYQAYDTG